MNKMTLLKENKNTTLTLELDLETSNLRYSTLLSKHSDVGSETLNLPGYAGIVLDSLFK